MAVPMDPAPPISPIQRIVRALGVSAEAFRLPSRTPDWLVPLLLITLVSIGSAVLLGDLIVAQQLERAKDQMESSSNLSAEQREEQLDRMTSGTTANLIRYSSIISMAVMPSIGALITAGLLLLILNFGMGGAARFRDLWFFACLSGAPSILREILRTILALARSDINISFGPAAFVSPDNLRLFTFLQSLDLFYLWVLAVQLVGISQVSGLPQRKSRTAIVILWILGMIFAALMSLVAGCGQRAA